MFETVIMSRYRSSTSSVLQGESALLSTSDKTVLGQLCLSYYVSGSYFWGYNAINEPITYLVDPSIAFVSLTINAKTVLANWSLFASWRLSVMTPFRPKNNKAGSLANCLLWKVCSIWNNWDHLFVHSPVFGNGCYLYDSMLLFMKGWDEITKKPFNKIISNRESLGR